MRIRRYEDDEQEVITYPANLSPLGAISGKAIIIYDDILTFGVPLSFAPRVQAEGIAVSVETTRT